MYEYAVQHFPTFIGAPTVHSSARLLYHISIGSFTPGVYAADVGLHKPFTATQLQCAPNGLAEFAIRAGASAHACGLFNCAAHVSFLDPLRKLPALFIVCFSLLCCHWIKSIISNLI